MRAAGRPGRGERARVAARVRALLDAGETDGEAAARTQRIGAARHAAPPDAADLEPWLPGDDRRSPRAPAPPAHSTGLRWNPGRRGAAALGVAAVAAIAAIGWWLAAARPHALPLGSSSLPAGSSMGPSLPSASPSQIASPVASATSTSASAAMIVVDVAGRVVHPGVYRLRPGARVYDAVRAAGGPRRGASTMSLNLAAPLQDGEQVIVGVRQMAGGVTPVTGGLTPGPAADSSSGVLVNVNTATLEQLETLPGVGPVLGQNILDFRAANGPFASVDQLDEVSGIGPATLAQLRPLVSV